MREIDKILKDVSDVISTMENICREKLKENNLEYLEKDLTEEKIFPRLKWIDKTEGNIMTYKLYADTFTPEPKLLVTFKVITTEGEIKLEHE